MTPFSADRLNGVNPRLAGKAAFSCLHQLQNYGPEQQMAGIAVLFMLLARQHKVHVGDVLTVANNILDISLHQTPELMGAVGYLENEL